MYTVQRSGNGKYLLILAAIYSAPDFLLWASKMCLFSTEISSLLDYLAKLQNSSKPRKEKVDFTCNRETPAFTIVKTLLNVKLQRIKIAWHSNP